MKRRCHGQRLFACMCIPWACCGGKRFFAANCRVNSIVSLPGTLRSCYHSAAIHAKLLGGQAATECASTGNEASGASAGKVGFHDRTGTLFVLAKGRWTALSRTYRHAVGAPSRRSDWAGSPSANSVCNGLPEPGICRLFRAIMASLVWFSWSASRSAGIKKTNKAAKPKNRGITRR